MNEVDFFPIIPPIIVAIMSGINIENEKASAIVTPSKPPIDTPKLIPNNNKKEKIYVQSSILN